MSWTSLCELAELREGCGKYVEIGGFQLGVFLHEGQVYVLDNTCPHAGASWSAGSIDRGFVVCPRHNWPFHLATGELRDTPGVAITTYKTRIIEPSGKPKLVQADLPIY